MHTSTKVVFGVFLAGAFSLGVTVAMLGNRVQVSIDPKEMFLQNLYEGEIQSVPLIVRNDGATQATLTGVKATCACIRGTEKVEIPQVIEPGASVELPIEMHTSGFVGSVSQSVCAELLTATGQRQQFCALIHSFVASVLRPSKTRIVWHDVAPNEARSEQFELMSMLPEESVELISAVPASDSLDVKMIAAAGRAMIEGNHATRRAMITVTRIVPQTAPNPSFSSTVTSTQVRISYRHQGQEQTLTVPVTMHIVPDVCLYPATLVFDACDLATELTRVLAVKFTRQGASELWVEDVADGVSVDIERSSSDGSSWIVTVRGRIQAIASMESEGLRFRTGDGRLATVSLKPIRWETSSYQSTGNPSKCLTTGPRQAQNQASTRD